MFQAHCGQPGAVKGPKLDYGRIALPKVVFDIYEKHIQPLGMPWYDGCRGCGETFRDRCMSAKKKYINREATAFNQESKKLEDIAMVLYIERLDFVAQNKVIHNFIYE